ncbi:MAG: HU family DNA-binding protein [Planctomycetaceae bacterium]
MTKKEIVKAISEELGLTQLKTKEIVQKTFDAIVETLVEDRRIELRNFGVFEVKKRAARKARNPRTGGQVEVPAKFVVTFKPGKEMEERVRLLEEAENAREKAAAEATQARERSSRLTSSTPPASGGIPAASHNGPGAVAFSGSSPPRPRGSDTGVGSYGS